MDEIEGGGEFSVDTARYMFGNSGAVEDCPVPVFVWHLFLYEVGAGHLNESVQGAFDKTVGAMSLGGGCDDIGLVVVDTSEALDPHEFLTKVGMELAGEVAYVCAELGEGFDDIV